MRGCAYTGGYHDIEIQNSGLEVYPRLTAADTRGPDLNELVSTGNETFDRMLGGGLDIGTSTLIMGPAGSGKSTITAQLAAAAAGHGLSSAFFMFDERPQTLRARTKTLGIPFEELVEAGKLTVQQVDPAELTPGEFANAVIQSVHNGARVVVIDSIVGYLNAMAQERYLVLQLHELLTFLGQAGVLTVLVLGQSGRDVSPISPVDVSYLADTVIVTNMVTVGTDPGRSVAVYKRRSGAHEMAPRELTLGPVGITVGKQLEIRPMPEVLGG
jgi:circadian clock protein KaiC